MLILFFGRHRIVKENNTEITAANVVCCRFSRSQEEAVKATSDLL